MAKDDKPQSTNQNISEDDRRLFRESIGEVNKIELNKFEHEVKKPKPIPQQSKHNDAQVLEQLAEAPFEIEEVETGDELSFVRPGIQKNTLRKLRRGYFVVEQELDLHGLIVAEAKPVLNQFLSRALDSGKRCLRIIHGKGHGSKNKTPVLKNKLNRWLQQDDRVLAFCSARNNDGGTGAVYVLVKKL